MYVGGGRRLDRGDAAGVGVQRVGAAFPVAQHPACAAVPVDAVLVAHRPVGVAVDQIGVAVFAQQAGDGLVIHVHDGVALGLLLGIAFLPQALDEGFSVGKRPGQKLSLEFGRADLGAVLLVLDVVGAQRIAVGDQRGPAVQVDQAGIGEQRRAAGVAQNLAHQQVAVAVHQVHARVG